MKVRKTTFSVLLKIVFQLLPIISIFISLAGLYFANQANITAHKALKVNEAVIGFEIEKRSQDNVNRAYDDLYNNPINNKIMQKIRNSVQIRNREDLLKVVDVFELIGSDFCQGTAKSRHIKIILQNSLSYICNNDEIYSQFNGSKNGTAILCYEFYQDSKFASTLKKENLHTCEFVDSNKFENSLNKYRFEFK